MIRRQTREIFVGTVGIGAGHPVSVQSMATVPLCRPRELVAQIDRLTKLGCQIIRVAVDSPQDAAYLDEVVANITIPVVADIQFSAESAAAAILHGASCVRVNPGLFRDIDELKRMTHLAVEKNIPVRVGANSGSIGKAKVDELVDRGLSESDALATALTEGAMRQCELLESFGLRAIKVALKASSVPVTIAACRKFAAQTDYPMHLGVTEAGTPASGIVKSSVGIGALLLDGIGDTMRVSLTAPPEAEIPAAIKILEACGLRCAMPEIVSCPTCGRTEVDLFALSEKVERVIAEIKSSGRKITLKKVAVMGCPVNGPGEAKDADLGIAGSGNGKMALFAKGKVIGVYSEAEALKIFSARLRENSSIGL